METLADSFRCVLSLRLSVSVGESVRRAVKGFLSKDESPFGADLSQWMVRGARVEEIARFSELRKNPYRVALVHLIASGLQGYPILDQLTDLEAEMKRASIDELEEKLRSLPIKMLVPLLLFVFPAFLVLLFGPILGKVVQMLGS